jgi:ubiquinone/menaquinone biosynthesis C-methylase UbiE
MIEVAQGILEKKLLSTGQFEYVHGSAESLSFLEDSSVDLVISGACVRQEKLGGTVFL